MAVSSSTPKAATNSKPDPVQGRACRVISSYRRHVRRAPHLCDRHSAPHLLRVGDDLTSASCSLWAQPTRQGGRGAWRDALSSAESVVAPVARRRSVDRHRSPSVTALGVLSRPIQRRPGPTPGTDLDRRRASGGGCCVPRTLASGTRRDTRIHACELARVLYIACRRPCLARRRPGRPLPI